MFYYKSEILHIYLCQSTSQWHSKKLDKSKINDFDEINTDLFISTSWKVFSPDVIVTTIFSYTTQL